MARVNEAKELSEEIEMLRSCMDKCDRGLHGDHALVEEVVRLRSSIREAMDDLEGFPPDSSNAYKVLRKALAG
jgi:hypothetical protein